MIKVHYRDREILLGAERRKGGQTVIYLFAPNQRACVIPTIDLPNEPLEDNEFFVATWSENKELAKAAMESGLFADTGRRVETEYGEAQVWKWKEKQNV